MAGKVCEVCHGAGLTAVSENEGKGPNLFRLCPACRNSGASRAGLSSSPTPYNPWASPRDVSGQRRETSKALNPPPVVSFESAIAKRESAAAELERLVEQDRQLARDVEPGARERAVVRVLKSARGKELYNAYDLASYQAQRASS
jgi:hypothetical protein